MGVNDIIGHIARSAVRCVVGGRGRGRSHHGAYCAGRGAVRGGGGRGQLHCCGAYWVRGIEDRGLSNTMGYIARGT